MDTVTRQATILTRMLWTAVRKTQGPLPPGSQWYYIPNLLDPEWLSELDLPINENRVIDQSVALIKGHEFSRSTEVEETKKGYQELPRTQIYESIGAQSGSWPSLVDLLLAKLVRYEVTSDIYVSRAGDTTIGPHHDDWYGIIVQLQGAKEWTVWNTDNSTSTFLLNTGDVLLLPRGVRHDLRTPDHSVHIVFAVMLDEPISALIAP